MKLIYIANARMPTDKAHGIQIAKMCEAFANSGIEVELIAPKMANPIKEDIFSFYGIKKNFTIKTVYSLDLLRFKHLGGFAVYIQAFTFAFSIFFYVLFNSKKFKKDDIFYFRDEFSPWFLTILNKNIFLEIHAFGQRFKYYRNII